MLINGGKIEWQPKASRLCSWSLWTGIRIIVDVTTVNSPRSYTALRLVASTAL